MFWPQHPSLDPISKHMSNPDFACKPFWKKWARCTHLILPLCGQPAAVPPTILTPCPYDPITAALPPTILAPSPYDPITGAAPPTILTPCPYDLTTGAVPRPGLKWFYRHGQVNVLQHTDCWLSMNPSDDRECSVICNLCVEHKEKERKSLA